MRVTSLLRCRVVLPTQHIVRAALLRWHALCLGDVRNDYPTSLTGDTFTCAASSPSLTNAYIIAYGENEGLSTGERLERYGSVVRLVRSELHALPNDTSSASRCGAPDSIGRNFASSPMFGLANKDADGTRRLRTNTTPSVLPAAHAGAAASPPTLHENGADGGVSATSEYAVSEATLHNITTQLNEITRLGWATSLYEETQRRLFGNVQQSSSAHVPITTTSTNAKPQPLAGDVMCHTATNRESDGIAHAMHRCSWDGAVEHRVSCASSRTAEGSGGFDPRRDSTEDEMPVLYTNSTTHLTTTAAAAEAEAEAAAEASAQSEQTNTTPTSASHAICTSSLATHSDNSSIQSTFASSSTTPPYSTFVPTTCENKSREAEYYWDVVYVKQRACVPPVATRRPTQEEQCGATWSFQTTAPLPFSLSSSVATGGSDAADLCEKDGYEDESVLGDVIVAEWRKMKRARVQHLSHSPKHSHRHTGRQAQHGGDRHSSASSLAATKRVEETNDLIVENGVCFLNARQIGLCVLRMARLSFLARVEAAAKDVMEIPRSAHGGEEHRSLNIVDVSELDFSFSQTAMQCVQHMSLQLREQFSLSFVPLTDAAARRATLDTRSRARCVMRADGCAHDTPFDHLPCYHFDVGAYTAYIDVQLPPPTLPKRRVNGQTGHGESENNCAQHASFFYSFDHTNNANGSNNCCTDASDTTHAKGKRACIDNHSYDDTVHTDKGKSNSREDGYTQVKHTRPHYLDTASSSQRRSHTSSTTVNTPLRRSEHFELGVTRLALALSLMRRGAAMLVTFVPTPESSAALHAVLSGEGHAEVTREAQLIRDAKQCVAEAIARTGRWCFIVDEVLPAVDAPQGSAMSMMIVMG